MEGGVLNHEKKKEILSQKKTLLTPVNFQYRPIGIKLYCLDDDDNEIRCENCSLCGTANCYLNYEETT